MSMLALPNLLQEQPEVLSEIRRRYTYLSPNSCMISFFFHPYCMQDETQASLKGLDLLCHEATQVIRDASLKTYLNSYL